MLPGPTLIYRCTHCQEIFSRRSISSGNTLGAEYRSDGKMNARMLPRVPALANCPHCGVTFNFYAAEFECSFNTYFLSLSLAQITGTATQQMLDDKEKQMALARKFKNAPGYKMANASQCLRFVQSHELPVDSARAVRTHVWRTVNDERIVSAPRALTGDEIDNLLVLKELVNTDDPQDTLLRAEICREIEQFDAASVELQRDFNDHLAAFAEQLMRAIERRDIQPFMFSVAEWGEEHPCTGAWRARKALQSANPAG